MTHPKTPHVVDARYMEPPGPFVATMEMLDTLQVGEKMVLLLFREPHPLYKVLRQSGHPAPVSGLSMQALLSFENAPPFAAPLRFFLTAPLFAVLAGLLVAWEGPGLFASRWMPGALAATHLVTVGFMLQVMLGAMIQILPVVAGANLRRPLRVA